MQSTHVLYAYYQTEEQESNLLFFLDKGIVDEENTDYYFLITSPTISQALQDKTKDMKHKFIYVPSCETDGTAWSFCINQHFNKVSPHDIFIFINSSCCGPFLPAYNEHNWIHLLKSNIKSDVHMVGTIVEVPQDTNTPFIHSFMFMLDGVALDVLKQRGLWKVYCKKSAVMGFERNLTAFVLQANLNIKSLLSSQCQVNWLDKKYWSYNLWTHWSPKAPSCPEIPNNYYGINIHPFETLFIKNIRNANLTRSEKCAGFAFGKEVSLYKMWLTKSVHDWMSKLAGSPWTPPPSPTPVNPVPTPAIPVSPNTSPLKSVPQTALSRAGKGPVVLPETFRMYILSYDEQSNKKGKIAFHPTCYEHIQLGLSKYCESSFYIDHLPNTKDKWMNKEARYIGTLSYRVHEKVSNIHSILSKYQVVLDEKPDVVYFWNNNTRLPLVKQAQESHPKFTSVWVSLLEKLGYGKEDILNKNIPVFFGNFWMATPEWMSNYIEFFKRAYDIMEADPELQQDIFANSGYTRHGALSTELCMKIFDRPYYTHHPFVCERLACFYFWKHGAKIKNMTN